MEFNEISVIGLGYIGLPTAAMFAKHALRVNGVDTDLKLVDSINAGQIPMLEPDLADIVKTVVTNGKLQASTEVKPADAFIIAVPTPFKANNVPDLSYVKKAIEAIAPQLKRGNLIILESTSPVGTTEKIPHWIAVQRPDLNPEDIYIAYCPERVLPGRILHELVHNDRVIGGLTPLAAKHARQLYEIFVNAECIITEARTAEMSKLTENAFRDVNIAFANELSMICDKLKIDVWELIELANRHPRVNILQPGPGVGGHCIAVDPWFIVDATPRDVRLIRAAREVNDAKPSFIVEKIIAAAKDKFATSTIACLGLSYKANVNDIRESPALEVVQRLARETLYKLVIVEPHIEQVPSFFLDNSHISFLPLTIALKQADIIVLLVDHDVFKQINYNDIAKKIIIDTRGILVQKKQN